MPTANVTDRQKARINDQYFDAWRRMREGSLDPDRVSQGLQAVIEDRWDRKEDLPFADEAVAPSYGYPSEFRFRSPKEQLDFWLGQKFAKKLDGSKVAGLAKQQEERGLPGWVEGMGVVPKFSRLGGYNAGTKKLFALLAASREFHNYREDEFLDSRNIRPIARTRGFLWQMDECQEGDFLVFPFQFGMKWRGKSIRHSRVRFEEKEFGLCHYLTAGLLCSHPDRITGSGQLYVDCAGSEYAPAAVGAFFRSLYFCWCDERLSFDYGNIDCAYGDCGAASALSQ